MLAPSPWSPRVGIATLVAVAMVATGCGDDGGPERDESGALVEPGPIDPFDLEIGDCFDDPAEIREEVPSEATEVVAVPCSEPHDNEVFALVAVPETEEYPGADELQREGTARCETRLAGYVGPEPEEMVEVIAYLFPSAESWDRGDRQIVCVLYGAETPKLAGSMAADG